MKLFARRKRNRDESRPAAAPPPPPSASAPSGSMGDTHRPPPVPIELIDDARWRAFDPAEWFTPEVPAEIREASHPMPSSWHRMLIPLRWRPSARIPIPDHSPELGRAFIHEILRRNRHTVASVAEHSPDAAPHLRTHPDDLESVASAALHWLVPHDVNRRDRQRHGPHVIDWWVEERSVVFALEAAIETSLWGWRWDDPAANRDETHRVFERKAPRRSTTVDAPMALRLTHHLARTSEAEFERAREVADRANQSLVRGVLAPVHASGTGLGATLQIVGCPAINGLSTQLSGVAPTSDLGRFGASGFGDPLPTLLDRFGADLVPWLEEALRATRHPKRRMAKEPARSFGLALAYIGTAPAMRVLARLADHPGLGEALSHAEEHHLPLLIRGLVDVPASEAGNRRLDRLRALRPDMYADAVTSATAAGTIAAGHADIEDAPQRPIATDDDLPAILADPPWLTSKPARPIILDDVELIVPPETIHPELSNISLNGDVEQRLRGYDVTIDQFNPATMRYGYAWSHMDRLARSSPNDFRQIMSVWDPAKIYSGHVPRAVRALAEHPLDETIDTLVWFVNRRGKDSLAQLRMYDSARLADAIVPLLGRRAALADAISEWIATNPTASAYAALPHLVAKPAATRRDIRPALLLLDCDHRSELDAAAAAYGPQMVEALDAFRATDPLDLRPARMPKVHDDLLVMPAPRLRDHESVISRDALTHLIQMLMISPIDEPYAGLEPATAVLDPDSTARFAWALFQRWSDDGYVTKSKWMYASLAHLGTDDTVRRLVPLIKKWPGERASKRATDGLAILGEIGTDLALTELFTMSRKLKYKGLKQQAQAMIDKIADARGLTLEGLADRLVPDFGLDRNGKLVLDLGSQTVTVELDQELVPSVVLADGKRRKSIPKAGADDDPELVDRAKREFAGLRKDVKSIAKEQLARHERGMVDERRWSVADAQRYFIDHPLTWTIAQRLVWGAFDGTSELRFCFRIAEDRTFADVDDDMIELDDGLRLGIVHPARLAAAERAAWAETLADYELLQPFDQLARTVTDPGTMGAEVDLSDLEVSEGRILALRHRGWDFEMSGMVRTFADGTRAHLSHAGYIEPQYIDPSARHRLGSVRLLDDRRLDEASALVVSELQRDIEYLSAGA